MKTLSSLRAFALLAGFALILTSFTHAILDAQNNGMSDLWEKQHNNGNLFPATFLATADPDQDGWTNVTEAIAGTNPHLANPPNGIIATTIEPTGTEGAFTLTWPTIIGKNYRLQASSNLTNWLNVGTAIVGTTNSHTLGISAVQPDTTIPPKLFWRIVASDLDTDTDGLTNAEENTLGTNPNSADSDGDTLLDIAEILAGTNPLDNDTDEDGIADNIDTTPLANNALADPDRAGLSPALTNGLTTLWAFESLQSFSFNGTQAQGYPNLITTSQPARYYGPGISGDGMISQSSNYQSATSSLIAAPQVFSGKANWTVALWFKMPTNYIQNKVGTINTVFWAYNNTSDTFPEFQVHAYKALSASDQQKLVISHYHNGLLQPDLITYIPLSAPLDNDTWQQLSITKQSGTIKVYRNATLLNQFTTAAGAYTPDATGYFAIGRLHQATTADTAFRGKIDRFTIHNRALSTTEITALYHLDSDYDGLWDITENEMSLWRDTNSDGIKQPSEVAYVFASPYLADPRGIDHDGDGIPSVALLDANGVPLTIDEQTLGTKPAKADTDGDLMPDGWEHSNNLQPLNPLDGSQDPDNDGASNLEEYRNNTDPNKKDTDGDGTNDGPEIKGPDNNPDTDDGSDPSDGSDSGVRRPNDQLVSFKLGAGDRSGSHSEDYVLNVFRLDASGTEIRIFTLRSGGFGQYKEITKAFKKGESYSFQLQWQGSNNQVRTAGGGLPAEGPDYDYHMVVEPQGTNPGTAMLDSFDPRTNTYNPALKLLDPEDVNAADDDDDDIADLPKTLGPLRVVFVSYDILEVFSDQIAGNEANKLPTPYYRDQPNNPMLMACTTGRTANIAVKLQCPSSLNSEILVGVRERLTTPILASVSATNGKTPLTFTANEGSKAYEVVAGIDMNANHILDVSEVDMVFQKTPRTNPDGTSYSPHPGTTGDPTFQWIDRFIVVTENDYIDARNETEGYNGVILSATHPIAAELIGAFATGATTVSKSTSTDYSISITAGTFGLSHPVGAIWSATNQAATHRIVYDSTTELANLVVNSNGVRSMFGRILFNNKAALIAASSPAWGVVTISYTDNNIDFASSDKARQVHAIFGKCESVGGMQVSCRLTPTGAVEIGALNCYGSITDLYDFAYSASPIANIEPKKAARTQAGFATLTSATWPNAGRFFFTKVEFGTGWINYTATYTP